MRRTHRIYLAGVTSAAALGLGVSLSNALPAKQDKPTADLTMLTTGGMKKSGYYMPQRLTLGTAKAAQVTKEPTYSYAPQYGALAFGPKDNKVTVVLDEAPDATVARLFVDSNNDGDLTNDAPVEWKRNARKIKTQDGKDSEMVMFEGTVTLQVKPGGKEARSYGLNVYRFAPETAKTRNLPADMLLYYRDYAQSGKLKLGGKEYSILLLDELATGRFDETAHGENEPQHVTLMIDRNGNGQFEGKFERYDLSKPFNIGGKSYEVDSIASDGSRLTLKNAATAVAEVPLPADLSVGQKAMVFKRPVIGGKTVSFPGDFKGKVVMLDFWATWCGPCRAELPNLVKAYEKYHGKGFEILGISLDQANQEEKVKKFLDENKMPWSQVYDGKFWSAEIAQMYGVDSIPHALLVDGNTGKILAETGQLRGEALDGTLAKALDTTKKTK